MLIVIVLFIILVLSIVLLRLIINTPKGHPRKGAENAKASQERPVQARIGQDRAGQAGDNPGNARICHEGGVIWGLLGPAGFTGGLLPPPFMHTLTPDPSIHDHSKERLSIYTFTYMSVCISVLQYMCLDGYMSICLYAYISITMYLSCIYVYVCTFVMSMVICI